MCIETTQLLTTTAPFEPAKNKLNEPSTNSKAAIDDSAHKIGTPQA